MARRPPYFRMAIGVLDHPKVAPLHDSAIVTWVALIDYSARNKTDGIVPAQWAQRVRGKKYLDAAIRAGLVETTDDPAYLRVHDYLYWQTSREQQDAIAAARAAAGAQGGRPPKPNQ